MVQVGHCHAYTVEEALSDTPAFPCVPLDQAAGTRYCHNLAAGILVGNIRQAVRQELPF